MTIGSNWEIAQPWVRDGQGRPCSFATLATLPAESVDVTITDPPFNAIVQNNIISGTAMKRFVEAGGGGGGIPRIELPFEPLEQFDFACDLVRVSRRWALAFCAVEDFGEYRRALSPMAARSSSHVSEAWVRGGIWYKPNSSGQMTGDRPKAAYEGIAIMHRPTKKRWNGRGSFGVWMAEDEGLFVTANGTRGEKDRHPNQKSLELCLKLVALFSERGETVFDPFVGSGRIGEACLALGRKYVGLERDPVWVDRAAIRLAALDVPFGGVSDEQALRLCACPKPSDLAGSRQAHARGPARAPRGRPGSAPPTA